MEITTDLLFNAGSGVAVGAVIGYLAKKSMKIMFKIAIVIGVLYIGSLAYLQNIKVIAINQQAMDNLINSSYAKINSFVGAECASNITNSECIEKVSMPFHDVLNQLGLPLTSGLGAGFLLGWMKA